MRLHPNHPIHTQILTFWGNTSTAEYCQKILTALKTSDETEFTLRDICNMAEVPDLDLETLAAMNAMSCHSFAIFDIYGYMKKSDGTRIILSPEEMDKAIQDQALPHPETGEMIQDPAKHTALLYRLRKDATRPPEIGEVIDRKDSAYGTYHYQWVAHIDLLKCGADNPLPNKLHPRTAFHSGHMIREWGRTEIFIAIPLRSVNTGWRENNPDCNYRKSHPRTQFLPISMPDKEFQEWASKAAPWIISHKGQAQ